MLRRQCPIIFAIEYTLNIWYIYPWVLKLHHKWTHGKGLMVASWWNALFNSFSDLWIMTTTVICHMVGAMWAWHTYSICTHPCIHVCFWIGCFTRTFYVKVLKFFHTHNALCKGYCDVVLAISNTINMVKYITYHYNRKYHLELAIAFYLQCLILNFGC